MTESQTLSFSNWLQQAVPSSTPDGVVAYNFNLAECGDWIVELIGAGTYDRDDPEWACPPELWSSQPLEFVLARSVAGTEWEQALAYVTKEVRSFIENSSTSQANVLRIATAVCVGFVDGDLVEVWPADEA